MKRLLASTLAAAVGLLALAGAADAKPWWGSQKPYPYVQYGPSYPHGYPQHPHGYYYRYDPGPAIIAGIFGTLLRAIPATRSPYRMAYGGPPSHDAWCHWRYRTYNSATNTYFVRPGVPAVCVSPYL